MKVLGNGLPLLVKNHERAIKLVAQLDFMDAMVTGRKTSTKLGRI